VRPRSTTSLSWGRAAEIRDELTLGVGARLVTSSSWEVGGVRFVGPLETPGP